MVSFLSQTEWDKDAEGCDTMSYPQFFKALFELCGENVWNLAVFGSFLDSFPIVQTNGPHR